MQYNLWLLRNPQLRIINAVNILPRPVCLARSARNTVMNGPHSRFSWCMYVHNSWPALHLTHNNSSHVERHRKKWGWKWPKSNSRAAWLVFRDRWNHEPQRHLKGVRIEARNSRRLYFLILPTYSPETRLLILQHASFYFSKSSAAVLRGWRTIYNVVKPRAVKCQLLWGEDFKTNKSRPRSLVLLDNTDRVRYGDS
jgi:hypothetical protein